MWKKRPGSQRCRAMKILLLAGLFSVIFSIDVLSQKQLVLVKQNKVIVRISEGEYIRFKRKNEDHFTKGIIEGIQQEFFRIGEDTTYLYNVAAIDMKGRHTSGFKIRESGITLMVAGAVLLIIDAINEDKVDSGVVIVSGSFIAAGIIMQFVNDDIYKIGRKKKIITMGN